MMKIFIFLLFFTSCLEAKEPSKFEKVFKALKTVEELAIPDPISDQPVNTKLLIIRDSKKAILGYAREVKTTTGCNSDCLPVIFTLYYNKNKEFLDLTSEPGLTKKNHEEFTQKDYFDLKSILLRNPKNFENIKHPYELVDMVSGATKKKFEPDVVKLAAYSSLRINTYNQQTLKFLSSLNKN